MAVIQQTVKVLKFKCERCGYEWTKPVPAEKPLRCAKCKSPYWDRPKQTEAAD